jgi:hypothetical protein
MTTTDRRYGVAEGLAWKAPVRAATITVNLTLSGEQTVDTVALIDGDRVLAGGQTVAADRGIYIVSTGAWSRAPDCDGARDLMQGTCVIASGGSTAGLAYQLTTTGTIIVGTTSLTFAALPLVEVAGEQGVQGIQGPAGPAATVASTVLAGYLADQFI